MIHRDRLMSDLAALAEELCDPHRHTEVIWDTDQHRHKRARRAYTTTQEGLLAQLREIGHEGLKVSGSTKVVGKPGSKPPGLFEAMARHVYIAVTVAHWCQARAVPLRMSVEANIRALVGAAPAMDDATLARFVREVRYWHGQAATATGWAVEPFRPWVGCPGCGRVSSLCIALTDDGRDVRSAYCANADRDPATDELLCGASWTEETVAELVDYIRNAKEAA